MKPSKLCMLIPHHVQTLPSLCTDASKAGKGEGKLSLPILSEAQACSSIPTALHSHIQHYISTAKKSNQNQNKIKLKIKIKINMF